MFQHSLLPRGLSELDRSQWKMSGALTYDSILNCCKQVWLLKKSGFLPNSQNLGDTKCLENQKKSFVEHPSAILFLRISSEGVFQQPQAITPTTVRISVPRSLSIMATIRQQEHTKSLRCVLPTVANSAERDQVGFDVAS